MTDLAFDHAGNGSISPVAVEVDGLKISSRKERKDAKEARYSFFRRFYGLGREDNRKCYQKGMAQIMYKHPVFKKMPGKPSS